ncbi:MAG: J domain-containing protein [Cytophaga sp.]|uniref:J domain-containing protein n=1 Tax=Cytophaga sp. TaxID=29535 RepID=UPI003F81B913
MHKSIDSYYKVLEISSDASIDEIKHAYKRKAKQLHPDKNKGVDAHEQFILVTEAYEFLKTYKTGKLKNSTNNTFNSEWETQKEKIRTKAKQYAEMQYEEFKKTDQYKNVQAANTVILHLYFFSSVILIMSPLWGYIYKQWSGFFVGLFVAFISIQYWAGIFTEKIPLNLASFFQSLLRVFKTHAFIYTVIILLNLYIFFNFTLNTQLTIFSIALLGLLLYSGAYFFHKILQTNKISKRVLFLLIIPTLFNIFFLINFTFSSNPEIETYTFVYEQDIGRRGHISKTSYIHLINDQYEEYHWFRMFFDLNPTNNKSKITYVFEDGLFGLRVLKSYVFSQ